MLLERCAELVLSPVDRLLKLWDIQTAEDVKIKTKTGAFCTYLRNPLEFRSAES